MKDERDVSLFEPRAKLRTVTVAQRMIKYGGRQGTILHSRERVTQ
jgi:hypothetical protein